MADPQGRTAIYKLYDRYNVLIYVGITNNPPVRWEQHASVQPWWHEVVLREVEWLDTREVAEVAEARAISRHRPKYNIDWGQPERGSVTPHGKLRKGWTPPQELLDMFGRYDEELLQAGKTRDEIEAYLVEVMWTGVAATRITKFVPWRAPQIQALAKKAGVPPLKKPTVIGIRKLREMYAEAGLDYDEEMANEQQADA